MLFVLISYASRRRRWSAGTGRSLQPRIVPDAFWSCFSSSSVGLKKSSSGEAAEAVLEFPTNDGDWLEYSNSSSTMTESNSTLSNVDEAVSLPVFKLWSNNQYVSALTSTTAALEVTNPATGLATALVPETTSNEMNAIVTNAVTAFQSWRFTPVQQRQRIMFKYLQLVQQYERDLVNLIVAENGKTTADATGDVFRGIEVIETACQVSTHLLGDSLQHLSSTSNTSSRSLMDTVSYREPLGVCAGVCPFNFPAMIPLWMFPLAITCGNTFVLKPSEKTPATAMLLAELTEKAGMPPNVLQVVHGGYDTVERICHHPDIKAISFVGSNPAGEAIFASGTANGKRVQSNMGAKNHAIIMMDEYDNNSNNNTSSARSMKDAVVKAVVGAGFGAAGQRCMALSVVLLVGTKTASRHKQEQAWIGDIVRGAEQLRVGPGWDPTTDIGPLITKQSKDRILSLLRQRSSQSELHLDGRTTLVQVQKECEGGNFLGPTVIELSADNAMNDLVYTQELFGPVLVIVTGLPTLDDAVQFINKNPFGNGCSIFCNSGSTARQFATTIDAGQVGINVPIPVPLPMFSFTGNKNSIRGDLNFYGKSGVQFYTQLKTITSNWLLMQTNHDDNNNNNNNDNSNNTSDSPDKTSSNSSNVSSSFGGITMPTIGKK